VVPEDEIAGLRKFVSEINREAGLIVVEGKRDLEALRSIGVRNRIVRFHSFGGINSLADAVVSNPKVILLLDGDRKGRYLAAKTVKKIERRTRVDLSFKKRLVRITRGKVRFVEQLASYGPLLK